MPIPLQASLYKDSSSFVPFTYLCFYGMFSDKWLAHGYFTVPETIFQGFQMFYGKWQHQARNVDEKTSTGNTVGSSD